MIRLLGVLVGSALAVAALVVFVGIPQFTTEATVAEQPVITLPIRPQPLPPDPTGPVAEVTAAGDAGENAQPPVATASRISTPAALPAEPAGDPDAAAAQAIDRAPTAMPVVAAGDDLHWYAFWSPFRSEIAAQGFVERLQSVTGLDYRVVKVRNGVYEVAFAYADNDEINANLSRISAATGLELQGT